MTHLSRILLPPVWCTLAFAVMLGLDHTVPLVEVVPVEWRWLAVPAMILGLTLAAWAMALFVRAGTPVKPFAEAKGFVRNGPYRFSRNPMYLGLLLLLIGAAIGFGSLTPWLVLPAFVFVINRRFIEPEEAMLEKQFGEDYRRYRASVRRWL